MKKIILVIVGIVLASLAFFIACAATPSQVIVKISCDEFNKQAVIDREVEIALGGLMVVQVCADPTMNSEWLWHINGTPILSEVDVEYETSEGVVAGVEVTDYVRIFAAGAEGNTNLVLEQVRSGVPGKKGPWKLNLKVTVK
jgi:hypothetical protein